MSWFDTSQLLMTAVKRVFLHLPERFALEGSGFISTKKITKATKTISVTAIAARSFGEVVAGGAGHNSREHDAGHRCWAIVMVW